MDEETKLDPKHDSTRQTLRRIGPPLAGAGLLLMVIGIGSFFASFGTFQPPRFFWCAFVGMPLLAVGIWLSQFGYLGAIARYSAGEMSPVVKDTFNYMAEGTQEGVKTAAAAVAEGIATGLSHCEVAAQCPKCGQANDGDARFCKHCGAALNGRTPHAPS